MEEVQLVFRYFGKNRFSFESEGVVESIEKISFRHHFVKIKTKYGTIKYSIQTKYSNIYAEGTAVKVFRDKRNLRFFLGEKKEHNEKIIKEYYNLMACNKYHYVGLLGIILLFLYFMLPQMVSLYETLHGIIFCLLIVFLANVFSVISTVFCYGIAKTNYFRYKKNKPIILKANNLENENNNFHFTSCEA